MTRWFRNLVKPSIEMQLHIIKCKKRVLLKDIEKGRCIFYDNDVMVKMTKLLTSHLMDKYNKRNMTKFELLLIDKIYKDDFRYLSFFLQSDLDGLLEKEDLKNALIEKGFELIEGVGYFHTEFIPFVKLGGPDAIPLD